MKRHETTVERRGEHRCCECSPDQKVFSQHTRTNDSLTRLRDEKATTVGERRIARRDSSRAHLLARARAHVRPTARSVALSQIVVVLVRTKKE